MEQMALTKKSFIDSALDKLPFELHLPSYNFLGPGTRLTERLTRGDKAVNLLDSAALKHDLAYAENKNRRAADQELIDFAFERLADADAESDERAAALITACCLVSKITLEKFCARVKKVFRCKRIKTKRVARNAAPKKKEKKARKKIEEGHRK